MKNLVPWFAAAACAIAGPYVVGYVVGYWALLMVPTIEAVGASTRPSILVVMAIFNVIGALLAAVVLSVPLGFFARPKPWAFGIGVGLIVVGIIAIGFLNYQVDTSWPHWLRLGLEAVAFVGGLAVFTSMISHLRRRHAS